MGQSEPPAPSENTADHDRRNRLAYSTATVKHDAKFAEAVIQLGITKEVMAGKEKRSRKEIIQAASSPPKSPLTPKPEPPLEEILVKRWNAFIKDIPVTKHSTVRIWLTRKLQSHAL